MKLQIIYEDKDVILVEEALRTGTINEGFLGIMDTAVEAVFGAVGSISGIGEPADFILGVKNLVQGDYIGAAIFFISMEPSPVSDIIGKSLRIIQKIAQHTGQEERLNKIIGWLIRKTNGRQSAVAMNLLNRAKSTIDGVAKKAERSEDLGKEKGIFDRIVKYIDDNFDQMKDAFEEFLDKIEDKAKEIKFEPTGGFDSSDVPEDLVNELASEIKETYGRLMDSDVGDALLYKKKLRSAANKKPEVRGAYEIVFGKISEIK